MDTIYNKEELDLRVEARAILDKENKKQKLFDMVQKLKEEDGRDRVDTIDGMFKNITIGMILINNLKNNCNVMSRICDDMYGVHASLDEAKEIEYAITVINDTVGKSTLYLREMIDKSKELKDLAKQEDNKV